MAIVRHIKSNVPYKYLGENKFRNLVTGAEGIVDDEIARKIFKINLELTELCGEFPVIETMISKLKLKIDVVSNKE